MNDNIEDLFKEYSPRLLGYIRSRVDNREDAEDILQDVFYQLARYSDDSLYEIDRISSWLFRVAHNMVSNFLNKKREVTYDNADIICANIAETIFASPHDNPDSIYLRNLIWQELDIALSELPPEQCEVFCLTFFDRIPVKDISSATGIPVATLLSRKHYAVKHLRKRFRHLYVALMQKD